MLRRAFSILVAIAATVLGASGLHAGAVLTAQGKIAFLSDRAGESAIYVMDVDGSNVTRLTAPVAGGIEEPALSPDGHKIAFSSAREISEGMQIYVMNTDGSNVTRLHGQPGSGGAPSFSPDGRRIAFSSNLGGFPHIDQQIDVMNADGSNATRLTGLPGICDNPKFSPDGRKIVFDVTAFDNDLDRQIYVIDSDGSNVRRLTNLPAANSAPSFSPDGRKIAFASLSATGGGSGIYVMNADGSHVTHLTSVRNVPPFGYGGESSPAYSPDGRRIAFSSHTPEGFRRQIYLVDADGSNLVRLTKPPGQSWYPAFIP